MNNELRFGVYAALVFILWCMIEFFTGLHNQHHEIAQYTEVAGGFIPWIFIYAGIRHRKQLLQNGKLTFGQGVRSGMVISLVSSVIMAVFLYVYVNVINRGYNASKIDFLRSELIKANVPDDVFRQQVESYQNMYSGTFTAHFSLLVSFASMGIVISALISLILRTRAALPADN